MVIDLSGGFLIDLNAHWHVEVNYNIAFDQSEMWSTASHTPKFPVFSEVGTF